MPGSKLNMAAIPRDLIESELFGLPRPIRIRGV
jgi:transcriptional regulator with PAS, ATPase and Fis domain